MESNELDSNTIENIKNTSSIPREINRLKDIDEVGMLDIDVIQSQGMKYIQINHDLRILKNSLNNCIRRVNLLTKEISSDKYENNMKLIDLFNKIVNEEELPNKIKIRNDILVRNKEYHLPHLQDYYYMENVEGATWRIWCYDLNDEVEIIGEEE